MCWTGATHDVAVAAAPMHPAQPTARPAPNTTFLFSGRLRTITRILGASGSEFSSCTPATAAAVRQAGGQGRQGWMSGSAGRAGSHAPSAHALGHCRHPLLPPPAQTCTCCIGCCLGWGQRERLVRKALQVQVLHSRAACERARGVRASAQQRRPHWRCLSCWQRCDRLHLRQEVVIVPQVDQVVIRPAAESVGRARLRRRRVERRVGASAVELRPGRPAARAPHLRPPLGCGVSWGL